METKERKLVRQLRHVLLPSEQLKKTAGRYQLIGRTSGFVIDPDVNLAQLYRETKILNALGPNDPLPDSLNLSPAELEIELAKCQNAA
jgi:hypothetical protein